MMDEDSKTKSQWWLAEPVSQAAAIRDGVGGKESLVTTVMFS